MSLFFFTLLIYICMAYESQICLLMVGLAGIVVIGAYLRKSDCSLIFFLRGYVVNPAKLVQRLNKKI